MRLTLSTLVLLALLPLQAFAERGFQARDLATLARVNSPTLSPDGGTVVFAQREVDSVSYTHLTLPTKRIV